MNEYPSRYVDAGGIRTHYIEAGSGAPVVLIHGGGAGADGYGNWMRTMPALAKTNRVIAVDMLGFGKTDKPDAADFVYSQAARNKHMTAFLEALGLKGASLVGNSMGGCTAIGVAVERPELVGKLVLMAQSVSWEGVRPELAPFAGRMTTEMVPPELKQAYEALSPDGPEHLDVVLGKLLALWNTDPAFPLSDLERVAAPALVLAADDDVFLSIEHAAAMQRARPDSQLAVVPGASHAVPMEKPELVNRLILDFLAEEQVEKRFKL